MLFVALYSLWMGACTASFLGVVVDRGGWRQSLTGRSHCVCGKNLSGLALIPVLGWLLCGGRARCCGAKIPGRYPVSEAELGWQWFAGAVAAYAWASPAAGRFQCPVIVAVAVFTGFALLTGAAALRGHRRRARLESTTPS